MTEKDKQKQITGYVFFGSNYSLCTCNKSTSPDSCYDVCSGKFGYLRGAYNGHIGYDAICILFQDVSWDKEWKVKIKLLKSNLEILEKGLFKTRKKDFYSEGKKDLEIQSYRDFVKLAEKLIKDKKNPKVHFSY